MQVNITNDNHPTVQCDEQGRILLHCDECRKIRTGEEANEFLRKLDITEFRGIMEEKVNMRAAIEEFRKMDSNLVFTCMCISSVHCNSAPVNELWRQKRDTILKKYNLE